MTKTKPYAKMRKMESENKFQVHLHNPTDTLFAKVTMRTGGFTFSDDELVTTETVNKEFGELAPRGSLQVDESDLGELDFKIWYEFQLYDKGNEVVGDVKFSI